MIQSEDILLSVIVPIYNTDLYLSKCIQSIRNQTYTNLEIILINDGSTDGSAAICDEYQALDNRIRVWHKQNAGRVAARKYGCKQAKGKLITFVDSDDWIEQDMYACMLDRYNILQPDLITSGLIYEQGCNIFYEMDNLEEGIFQREEIKSRIVDRMMYDLRYKRRSINPSLCTKIFKASMLMEEIIKIDESIIVAEDAAIVYPFIVKADKIQILHKCWYHYRQWEHPMEGVFDLNTFEGLYRLKHYLVSTYQNAHILDQTYAQIQYYIAPLVAETVKRVYGLEPRSVNYIFPYEKVPQGSKVVIYGAGVVGQCYWKCLNVGTYASVVAWVDKKYEQISNLQSKVLNPEIVRTEIYDFIIIAVLNQRVAEDIMEWLLKENIARQKIVWEKPKLIE